MVAEKYGVPYDIAMKKRCCYYYSLYVAEEAALPDRILELLTTLKTEGYKMVLHGLPWNKFLVWKGFSDMRIQIQRFKPEDIDIVYHIQRKAYYPLFDKYKDSETSPYLEPKETVFQKYTADGTCGYLFLMEGQAVGAVRIGIRGTVGKVSALCVLPEYQNQGIAQIALRRIEAIHPEIEQWILDTILEEQGNCHLYEKLGYVSNGRVESIHENMHLVFYEKKMPVIRVRYVEKEDRDFWYTLDKHLPEQEFEKKVRDRQGYVILENEIPVGILRYNLFWDNTPFCTLLFVDWEKQNRGYGSRLMEHWEADMKAQGYGMVLTSTQVDEQAQHFYRKLGYKDCGGFVIDIPGFEQPMELFLSKSLNQ